MSEQTNLIPARRDVDRGMTLPELLVCVAIMGLIVTVLSSAIVVTLRQQSSTEGRLNVARSEQSIGLWMPADLASADEVITDPAASPCAPDVVCPVDIDLSDGSNVVMMSWAVDSDASGNGFWTNVSYHFTPSADGVSYELWRVECIKPYTRDAAGDPVLHGSFTCTQFTVLRDLVGPPNDVNGNATPFVAGVTMPTWVIRVTEPLAPDAIAGPDGAGEIAGPDPSLWKDANRVIVTIDGGGETAGAGGGRNQISITAGGTTREDIASTSMVGSPSFVAARSRCGGPITLVIDESQSIGATNIVTVKNAVRAFIDTLRGTPVRVQIVTFTEQSRVLGAGTAWHKYWDMTDPLQADQLYNLANDIKLGGAGGAGYTNWEEALYRVGYEKNGTVTVADMPHTVVFFTDGIPTKDRRSTTDNNWRSPGSSDPVGWPTSGADYDLVNPSGWPAPPNNTSLNQVSFNRAEWIANSLRGKTKLVGVGVGAFSNTDKSTWRFVKGGPTSQQRNKDILGDFIIGNVIVPSGTGNSLMEGQLGTVAGQQTYVNTDTARLYVPDWNLLPTALRAVALGECAGTITFQTRLATQNGDGQYPYATDPFRYIAQAISNPDGSQSAEVQKFAETNVANTARTFDLSIPGGQYVDVEFLPLNFTTAAKNGYSTNRWECSVAGIPVTNLPLLPTGDPDWKGFSLRINANGAASCTHFVNYTPPAG